jgi:hypothetical protein
VYGRKRTNRTGALGKLLNGEAESDNVVDPAETD